jgi:hypothetical protein
MKSAQKTFKDRLAKASALAMVQLLSDYSNSKFDIGSWNKVRLRKALAGTGDFDLAQRTLLCEAVHAEHQDRMSSLILAKAEKLKNAESGTKKVCESSVRQRCRFLTLIHSVEVLDVIRTVEEIKLFKKHIENVIYQSKGIWCIGSIEVEIISLDLMEKIQEENGVSEKRKLEVCKLLSKHLRKAERTHPSHFLLHFHGVLFASKEERFFELENTLKNYKINNKRIWSKAPRQIQLKPISEQFAGKKKTLNANLKDIARYITKGGNDWFAGKAYLQYKLAFENDDVISEEEWIQKNWRRNNSLRQERAEDGIESVLSLTKAEIIYLAQTIDAMMNLSRNRLGYVVKASSSPKKAAEYAAILASVDVPRLPI